MYILDPKNLALLLLLFCSELLLCNKINDTHIEELVLCWIQYKNSLKYKVGCFWRFSYVYTTN